MKLLNVFHLVFVFLISIDMAYAENIRSNYGLLSHEGNFYFRDSTDTGYDKVLSIGMGIGRLSTRSGYKLNLPPFGISIDRAAFDDLLGVDWFTTGGYIGYARYKWDYSGFLSEEDAIKVSEFTFASRWGVSVNRMLEDLTSKRLPDNLELYANLQIGYSLISLEGEFAGVAASGVYVGILAGARLSLKNFGVFAELGKTEAGLLKGGVVFRF